jgi:uncharacterized OsmC-like protein
MKAEELRALQAPLEAHYAKDPSLAQRTLSARGHVVQDLLVCNLESGRTGVSAGLHPAMGGDGSAAYAADMLLEALVSCAGVTLAVVATSMGIGLEEAVVHAEGDLDFRGTLGIADDAPVGFTKIRVVFALKSDGGEKHAELVRTTERRSVVMRTLAKSVAIETSLA